MGYYVQSKDPGYSNGNDLIFERRPDAPTLWVASPYFETTKKMVSIETLNYETRNISEYEAFKTYSK